jgi:transcriptional regulator with XRE-family HTH domain
MARSGEASQALFATYLNVSPNAVRSWEQGTRRPQQAALKLLVIAKKTPRPYRWPNPSGKKKKAILRKCGGEGS